MPDLGKPARVVDRDRYDAEGDPLPRARLRPGQVAGRGFDPLDCVEDRGNEVARPPWSVWRSLALVLVGAVAVGVVMLGIGELVALRHGVTFGDVLQGAE